MAKAILLALFFAALILSAAAFDSAAAARAAMELNQAAKQATSPRTKLRLLARAEQTLHGRRPRCGTPAPSRRSPGTGRCAQRPPTNARR